MLTAQTRWILLQTGRNSLWLWVRTCGVSEPGLRAEVQRIYDRMAEEVPWPAQHVNRVFLVSFVLPMAALYRGLRDRGRTEQEAVTAVNRAVEVMLVGLERRVMGMLVLTGPGRRHFVRAETTVVDVLRTVGAPEWEATFVERSADRMAVDVTRCYIFDTLRLLDAAPAVAAMCAHDAAAFSDLCPQLVFTRTGTLGTGADRCDFCLEFIADPTRHGPGLPPAQRHGSMPRFVRSSPGLRGGGE